MPTTQSELGITKHSAGRAALHSLLWMGATALLVSLFLARRGSAQAADITLSDTEFPAGNWTAHVASSGGASQTAQQNPTGGNPGGWRLMIHTIFPNSWIYVWHIYTGPGGTYDPSQGAITSLDFTLDQKTSSGNGVGGAFAVTQNGRYYTARYLTFNNTAWETVQATCLTAANFEASDGGPAGSPDFSAAGGPIQFGFARANPVPTVVGGIFDHGIDNWSVTIHRLGSPCGQPTPSPTPTVPAPTPTPSCPILTFSPPALHNAVIGTPYRHTITTTPGDYLFQAVGGIPPGLTLSSDGVLSGVPTSLGDFMPVVRASGGIFCEADHTFHMIVGPCLIPPPPTGLAIDKATASGGDLYSLTWDVSPLFGGHYDVLASLDGEPFQQIGITGTTAFTGTIPTRLTSTMQFQVKADWLCGPGAASSPSSTVGLTIAVPRNLGVLLPLRQLPDLQRIDVVLPGRSSSFAVDSPLLLARLVDPLSFPTPDFIGSDPTEKGDIFYSDADGTPNPDGSFVTLESVYTKTAPALGGLNVSEVQLKFSARTESANAVTSFVAMGDNAESSTVPKAADGFVATYAVLGNTNGGDAFARLRITLGFAAATPKPDLQVSIGGSPNSGGFTRYVSITNGGSADATGASIEIGSGIFSNVNGGTLVCAPPSPPGSCHIDVGLIASGSTASVQFDSQFSANGRYVTATDDGTHGPDANLADNSAGMPDTIVCVESNNCDACGVCEQICHIDNENGTWDQTTQAARSLADSARSLLTTGARLVLYYNFRDRFLAATPVGRHYIDLYNAHGLESVQLLLSDATLRTLATTAMASWEPSLRVLLNGPGTNATFTQPMADTMTALLERMKQVGSAGFRADIAREQSLLDLNALVGKTLDEAHRAIDAQPCAASETALCLGGGRFRVETAWTKTDGTVGSGHAASLTADSGTFWFFDPANVEMVVKTLNGCGVDQHYWVFAGGLTNVEVTMTVTDTQTGEVKTYVNPQGSAFAPILDTLAFATCSGAALLASNPEAASAKTPRGIREIVEVPGAPCAPGSTALCLDGGRFRVEAVWTTADGQTGSAQAVSLTGDSGYFWFFAPTNVEMLVKVLNGCAVDARQWVFAGGLTNVQVLLKVTDTQTGAVKTYLNPLGSAFVPIQDTSAFEACP